MMGRLEQLLQLHGMCEQEVQQLQENLENFRQSSAKMVAMMHKNWTEVERRNGFKFMIYDNVVTGLTKVMNFSRKLNIQLQLCNLDAGNGRRQNLFEQFQVQCDILECASSFGRLSSRQSVSEALEDYPANQLQLELGQSSQSLYTLEDIFKGEETPEDFVYPKLKVSENYQIGSTVDVIVAYIKNLHELQFYVLDCESKTMQEVFEVSQSLDLRQYDKLPPASEVFGLVLDKRIWRAVRSNVAIYEEERDENSWPCYLLDFGEIVYTKLSDVKYKLPEKLKTMPATALLCQIRDIKAANAMQEMLKQMEFKKCAITIRDILEDVFIVDLALDGVTENPDTTDTRVSEETLKSKQTTLASYEASSSPASTSSTYQQPIFGQNENNLPTSEPLKNQTMNTNPFLQSPVANSNSDANKNQVTKGKYKELTPEELEILNDEPSHTTNAMKAIFGHVPQDDKRLCRFYDPETGGCFKGRHCKLEHVPLNPEVWTKDVLPAASIVDKRVPQIIYPKGHVLNITPTYIGELGVFYAQINDSTCFRTHPLVWTDKEILTGKSLDRPPHVFELVLCRYDDGLWYRAQIVAADDDFKMFRVFYVDYGNHNVVGIKNLTKCDYHVAHIPSQAIRFRLAHLKEADITAEKRKAGVEMLNNMLLNQKVDVTVLKHLDDVIVMIDDDLNLTIKSKLVHGGYMKPF